jgi:hypothetical protein
MGGLVGYGEKDMNVFLYGIGDQGFLLIFL